MYQLKQVLENERNNVRFEYEQKKLQYEEEHYRNNQEIQTLSDAYVNYGKIAADSDDFLKGSLRGQIVNLQERLAELINGGRE